MAQHADLILLNAEIVTFDPCRPRATALAITNDRIAAVGDREVDDLRGGQTDVIDLQGCCVIPGINDTHAHMEREGLKEQRLSLAGTGKSARFKTHRRGSRPHAARCMESHAIGDPPYYFDALLTLSERRMPTKDELNAVAPQNPVYIPGLFGNWGAPPGHTALNSRAIALNGLTAVTCPRCSGVDFICDPVSGDPTGAIVSTTPGQL